jgi:hypothetical protein
MVSAYPEMIPSRDFFKDFVLVIYFLIKIKWFNREFYLLSRFASTSVYYAVSLQHTGTNKIFVVCVSNNDKN